MRRLLSLLARRVGRVVRELERQLGKLVEPKQLEAQKLLDQAKQILKQNNNPKAKDKLYSLHESNVDCISKGKAHKHYEFGVKVKTAVDLGSIKRKQKSFTKVAGST